MMRTKFLVGTFAALLASTALAQLPFTPAVPPSGVNNAVPTQNPWGPTGAYNQQSNYPYPGQCLADTLNGGVNGLFPLLNGCTANAGSFACTTLGGFAARSAGGWADCGGVSTPAFVPLNPVIPNSVAATLPSERFVWPLLNPIDYQPDTNRYQNADYYEIGLHEAWGFQGVASAGLFPNPKLFGTCPDTASTTVTCNPAGIAAATATMPAACVAFAAPSAAVCTQTGPDVPNGMQWTGLRCNIDTGCTCPSDIKDPFKSAYCSAGGKIPAGNPLFTPIWGVGQINQAGGPVTQVLSSLNLFSPGTPSDWSANNYVATWPSISIRGTKGKPVVVKWVNEFPNNHVFCPHPEAADWPCAIDRTFMGVKATIDPALGNGTIPTEHVNQFGSPQQPDNSWVTHLHGGEIPPSTDGFAELWYGNSTTALAYDNFAKNFVSPPFENPSGIMLKRPTGNFATYTYPMVNEEATIWFHDHTLGKTHHNVIAGPAGFFPVKEPLKHGKVTANTCVAGAGQDCQYTWLDPVTEPRNALGVPKYDLFLALQDRAFNDDGSINFSNALGQVVGAPSPVTPGANPAAHPVWVPEYFGEYAVINGVLWPKYDAEPGWYRVRIANGSDSRCYTIGFQAGAMPAPGVKPTPNQRFYVIASDQGYLQNVVQAPGNKLTMCPGERYEMLLNFSGMSGQSIYMTNEAAAPFPAGDLPYDLPGAPSLFPELNVLMRFDVNVANGPGVSSCARPFNWDPAWTQTQMAQAIAGTLPGFAPRIATCMPKYPTYNPPNANLYTDFVRPTLPTTTTDWPAGTIVRQVYLNERIDGVTQAPMGMQLNGVPFEYKVTETPKKDSIEVWRFINLTVDAHPMHPHLVRHLIVGRERFNARGFLAALCGTSTCSPGPAPGGEMQTIPDVEPFIYKSATGASNMTLGYPDSGWKDASQVPPGMVTTIVARWAARWTAALDPLSATAPGTAGCPTGAECIGSNASGWQYEPVTSGPYVWHCHINSHEDSEMMRSSLVVP